MSTVDYTQIESLKNSYPVELSKVISPNQLQEFKSKYLGKASLIKDLLSQVGKLPKEDRTEFATVVNSIKNELELEIKNKELELQEKILNDKLKESFFDFSLPGKGAGVGREHPITSVEQGILKLLKPLGFKVVYGPEVETEYYCFDSLNIPPHHPARDMQDTFYTTTGHVLRTHTTSVQARVLEKRELPVKVVSMGRVYRNETEDASHTAMFHQFELVWLEKGLRLIDLTSLIDYLIKGIYGTKQQVRYVPKFYPYTEPSIGVQIDCGICGGSGCSFCGGCGWSTIAGAGMVHSKVLKGFGYNPENVQGLAFGIGSGRLAAQQFKIPRSKMMYDGDLRVLGGLV